MSGYPAFFEKRYAALLHAFYWRCVTATSVNLTFLFLLCLEVFQDSTIAGYCLVAFLVCGCLSVLSAFTGVAHFPSPPFYRLPDTTYAFLTREWSERLSRYGYKMGPIAYRLDVTHDQIGKEILIAVLAPGFLCDQPTLVVSESFLVAADEPVIISALEHEIAHLRSGTYAAKVFASTLCTPVWCVLWCAVFFRVLAERFHLYYISEKLYGCELIIQKVSSQSFEHMFELIADALAAQEVAGKADQYLRSLEWLEKEAGVDPRDYEHDAHIHSHPSFQTRKAFVEYVFQ